MQAAPGRIAILRVDVVVDWQRWRANLTLPEKGYYEVWARATDMNGVSQPPVSPGWNPRGYANNIQHRIALIAA